jgi:hypothetical protein
MAIPPVPVMSYDAREQIMYVGISNMALYTESDVASVFEDIRRFWVSRCHRRKVYAIVDYTNFVLNIDLTEQFAQFVKQATETYAITVVRYTSDLQARTSIRAVAIRIHKPSNLYATKHEALQIVRALKSKTIALAV